MKHEIDTIGERIKFLRKRIGFSQLEFTEFLNSFGINITGATLSRYEANLQEPTASTIKAICKLGNVSVGWLLGDNEENYARVVELADTPDSKSGPRHRG